MNTEQKVKNLNTGLENNDPRALRQIYDIYNAEILPMFRADYSGKISSDKPVYLFNTGQPGAGKTAVAPNIIMREFPNRPYARIDADALREFCPWYKDICAEQLPLAALTNLAAMIWQNLLVLYCLEHNVELAMQDGTYKDTQFIADVVNGELARARKLYNGLGMEYPIKQKPAHKFQMWVIDTHPEISRLYAQIRAFKTFEEIGFCRAPEDAYLAGSLNGMYKTLTYASNEKVLDRIVIFNRDGEFKFDTNKDPNLDFGAALKTLHSRPLASEEQDFIELWRNNSEFNKFLKFQNLTFTY